MKISGSTKKCRVCGNKFFKEPILRYRNMPRVAQFLPDKKSLKKDKGINLKVFQCSGCGLVQLSNRPVPYYKEVIRASAYSAEMKDFRIKQFNKFVKQFSLRKKKIIEIGCGRGEYLSIMQKSGVKAYGLEYSKDSVVQCAKDNLNVAKGFIKNRNYKLKNAPFDAFFMLSYLEHLPDPNSTLKGIRNNLTSGAVGLIEVPNFNMIIKKKMFSEFMNDHLSYFTKDTLSATLELNGLEVVNLKEIWHDYIISAVVRAVGRKKKVAQQKEKRISKLDLSLFHKHQLRIKKEIKRYINCFKKKKVSIWGAGHQAFAIISMTNIAGKIKYVIDSAPFKQSKYTPATHIPIVPPETIDLDPVDAIIVIAGSYSDEVVRIIKKKYNKKINVSVLRNFGLERI